MSTTVAEIRLQVMWDRLIAVVEEQAQTLMRTAFATTVREAGDLSAGVFDTAARMVAQAVTGTPGHVNAMAEAVRHFMDVFPIATMKDGDHYISNDPWLTSGHLHDITVVSPVFHRGQVVALFACCCHQVDIGGLGQGPDGRSVFEEGLQIPIMKLADAGRLNESLLMLLRANVRTPVQVQGDVMSYIASNEVGARHLRAMLDEFALPDLTMLAEHVLRRSHEATLARIAALPKGTWRNSLTLDGYDRPITLRATLTIGDDHVAVDYAGTDDAVPFGINVVMNYSLAYTVFGIKCVVAPDVPNNAGALAPFRVSAPPGCILNVQRPSPVAARHVVGQMLPDLVLGCLHQALGGGVPAEGASCVWTAQLRGHVRGDQAFDAVFFNSGGSGARPGIDGLSATSYPAGVRATPVEVTEALAPIVIWRKELRTDSGGAGAQRGGCGQVIEVGGRHGDAFQVLAMYERVAHPARGRDGGADGAAGRVRLASGAGLRGKGLQDVPRGDRLVLELPGGGGLGDPGLRDPGALQDDLDNGLVSRGTWPACST